MTISIYDRIVTLLTQQAVPFRELEHSPEGHTARASEIRGHALALAAKALVLRIKRQTGAAHILAVVPGDCRVNLEAVKQLCEASHVMFAPVAIAQELTGCEMGAVPPMSFHPDLPVYLDRGLLLNDEIVFNAARLDRSMFVQLDSFIRATRPTLASFASE